MAAHRPPARTTLPRRPSRGGAAAAPGLLYWPNYIFGTRRHAGADGRWLNEYLRPTKDVAAYEGCADLSVVCCTRGAVDALDVVDWDALFQLSTRQAMRLLFGTTTWRRRFRDRRRRPCAGRRTMERERRGRARCSGFGHKSCPRGLMARLAGPCWRLDAIGNFSFCAIC